MKHGRKRMTRSSGEGSLRNSRFTASFDNGLNHAGDLSLLSKKVNWIIRRFGMDMQLIAENASVEVAASPSRRDGDGG